MALKKKDEELYGGYRPLDTSGNDYASMSGMSELHRAALDAAGQSWQKAKEAGDQEGMDAAHRQAEEIRAKYGYSGGRDGSQYLPTSPPKAEKFSYASAPSYANKYKGQIEALTQQILGRQPFSYDPETDPTFQQYRESYIREGKRAMEDTMGELAARTGGLASSFAGSTAQQAYNQHMAALNDKIPELRQLAYEMHRDEGDTQRANLDMLRALEQGDYAKYQDLLAQFNQNRNFDYGVFADQRDTDMALDELEYNRRQDSKKWDYQIGRDRIEDARYEDETAYDRDQTEREWAYRLGRDQLEDQRYEDETAYSRALAAQKLAQGEDGSVSGGDRDIYQRLFDSGVRNEGDAYAALLAAGYNTTQAGKLAQYFTSWAEGMDGEDEGLYGLNDLNEASLQQLGLGPVDYTTIEQLVEDGKLEAYTDESGSVSLRWVDGYGPNNWRYPAAGGMKGLWQQMGRN